MRRLGQHFLTDPNILQKIADALDPTPDDVVIEIGPGRGSLTAVVAPVVGRVIAIERDARLAEECGTRSAERGTENTAVVVGDALQLDWQALLETGSDAPRSALRVPRYKVLGNIPYYITSPLIEKALTPPLPERVVFLVQREVAERLAAPPGGKTYGALSVGVQAVCRVEQLFVVRAGAFRPPPRVDSAVVRLTPRADPAVSPAEVAAFRTFVTACFSRRRKQLRNAVGAATGATRARVSVWIAQVGLDEMQRPETLTPGEFAGLLRATRQL